MKKVNWENVIRRIKRNKRTRIFIYLQLVIGIFLLNILISTNIQINKDLNIMMEQGKMGIYHITPKVSGELFNPENFNLSIYGKEEIPLNINESHPFNQVELNNLQEKYNVNLRAEVKVGLLYFGESVKDYTIVYDSKVDAVSMSREFYDDITDDENKSKFLNLRDFPKEIDLNEIDISNEESYLCTIPFSYYEPYFHYKDLINTRLFIKAGENHNTDILENTYKIKEELLINHSDYEYEIDSEFSSFIQKTDVAKQESAFVSMILFMGVIMISVGIGGIFLMEFDRYKEEIAINIALGNTKKRASLEVLVDIFLMVISGTATGIILGSIYIALGAELATVRIKIIWESSVYLIMLSMCLGLFCSIPSTYKIRTLTPMELLRKAGG